MSKLSHFAADHPVIIAILMLTILVFGLVSASGLTTSLMTDLSLPQIYVIAIYPGASPDDVENDVSKVIEDEMSSVPGIKTISSKSGGSLSVVTLVFQDGENPEDKLPDVRDRLSRLRSDLPSGLQGDPWAIIGDTSMLPIMSFTMSNEDNQRLYDYLHDDLIPRISQIPGVSSVTVLPDTEKNVKVTLRLDDLAEKNISPLAVYQMISASSSNVPLGDMAYKERGVTFRYQGEYNDIKDIENVLVGMTDDNVLIRLKDVADVTQESKEKVENVIANGENAYYVQIEKRAEGDVIDICNAVKELLAEVDAETNGALHPEVLSDDSITTKNAIWEVVKSGILGAIMAIVATWICIGDLKATFIIGTSIPLCILLSIIMLAITGRTINLMTVAGMVVALGMVGGGAIVILEQVYRYIGTGKYTTKQAIYRGSDEVIGSILGSVLTTVVVFVPIVLMKGIVGKILSDVSLTLIYCMSASLIVAMVVIPFLIRVLRHDNDKVSTHQRVNKVFARMENRYGKMLSWSLDNKGYVILVSVALLVISALMVPMLGVSFLPSVDQNNFYINMTFPYTYTEEQTREDVNKVQDYLNDKYKELITNYSATVTVSSEELEQGGRNKVFFHINITPISEGRKTRIQKYLPEIQSDLNRMFTDAEIQVTNGGFDNLLGYVSDGGGFGVTLRGDDMEQLYAEATKIKEKLEEHPEVMSVSISTTYDNRDVVYELNHDYLSSLGVTSLESGLTSALLFRDTDVGRFRDAASGDRYKISITSDVADKPLTEEVISKIKVKSLAGEMISFENLGELKEEQTPTFINRKDRARNISVKATLISANTANVSRYINNYIKENPLPDGVTQEAGGIMELLNDSMGPLTTVVLIAVFLVYVVMVIQFERFRQPLVIMGCIPFCLIGVIIGCVAFGTEISVVSVLAIVALAGTVVNNGIILVDYINMERYRRRECLDKGIDASVLKEADCDIYGKEYRDTYMDTEWEKQTLRDMVILGSASRIKPILMTVVTTILGVLPMAYSNGDGAELMRPLGQGVFLGTFVSTIISLIVIPVLYYIVELHVINKQARKRA